MKKEISRISLGCCGLLILATTSGCGSDEWPTAKKVRISVKADQPGTGYQEGYSAREGFDIRIADMVATTVGKEAIYNDVSSDARQTVIGEGDADFVIATFSINDDRLAGKNGTGPPVDFVGPYAVTHSAILVRKSDYSGIRSVDDLKGKKVCTWPQTTSNITAQRLPVHIPVDGTDAGDCVRRLNSNDDVDAVFTDTLLLYGFTQKYPNLKVAAPRSGTLQYYGIALPKGHRDVCERLKKRLKDYIGSGEWLRRFKDELYSIDNPTSYQPTTSLINQYSCKDEVGR